MKDYFKKYLEYLSISNIYQWKRKIVNTIISPLGYGSSKMDKIFPMSTQNPHLLPTFVSSKINELELFAIPLIECIINLNIYPQKKTKIRP
jgi:hypothetical protein